MGCPSRQKYSSILIMDRNKHSKIITDTLMDIPILHQATIRQINRFATHLNNVRPILKFTSEIEINSSNNYLDLTVTKINMQHQLKTCRKPTQTDYIIRLTN